MKVKKVFGKRVLVQEVMTPKSSIISVDKIRNEEDGWNMEYTIIDMGDECPVNGIQIGEHPLFDAHSQFSNVTFIEKSAKKQIIHFIAMYDDIAGISETEIDKSQNI